MGLPRSDFCGTWLVSIPLAHSQMRKPDPVSTICTPSRQGWIDKSLYDRIVALLSRARLPITPPPSMTADQFRSLMAVDKKVC